MDPDADRADSVRMFADPAVISQYADTVRRFVPGYADLHRMTGILLAEGAPPAARVLVLGAGGGLELKALAEAFPAWRFVGVDPSPDMLRVARHTLGPLARRVELVEGYIDDAPPGPFDAATCLLTLHFLSAVERRRTVEAVRRRLRPGAPFVTAHTSFPQQPEERTRWLSRYAAFATASGMPADQADKARQAIDAHLPMLSPDEDAAILCDAGFGRVSLFFAAFTWRGWIAHA